MDLLRRMLWDICLCEVRLKFFRLQTTSRALQFVNRRLQVQYKRFLGKEKSGMCKILR